MPIVQVISLRPPDPAAIPRLLADLPLALATAIGTPPDQVWVYWQEVAAARMGRHPEGWAGHGPVVLVRARTRDELQVRRGLDATGRSVAASLGVPAEDVWVQWIALEPGRVYAGGAVH